MKRHILQGPKAFQHFKGSHLQGELVVLRARQPLEWALTVVLGEESGDLSPGSLAGVR